MHRFPTFLSPTFNQSISNSIPQVQKLTLRFLCNQSLYIATQFLQSKAQLSPSLSSPTNPNSCANPNFTEKDFTTLSSLLANRSLLPGPDLQNALEQTRIEPCQSLLLAIFDHFDSSPKPLFCLYRWAEKHSGYKQSASIFNAMINILAKSREFDSAWMMLLNVFDRDDLFELVSFETFAILMRRYARVGMASKAIRTFEFAKIVDVIKFGDGEMKLFEVLLDALCKEGLVREASDCLDRKLLSSEPTWTPSVRVYNILLNGWFRARKLKRVEQLWMQMRKENVVPTVVTYGTLVEGFCRMCQIGRAIELVGEMKNEGVEPNATVYNPIVDALAEGGRFMEAMEMLEWFSVLESGPTLSTYNSLVKGFCKAGNLEGASKILKMIISRGFVPTATTYNYFFRYFSKHGKIDEGMNLYTKMIDGGHNLDRLTFHLIIKMLCEQERLDLALQVSREMRARGYDMDLATSTMLVHLLCKLRRLEEAFREFEDMIRRGIIPQYLTYKRMKSELRKQGMMEQARSLSYMMASVPHSTKLPNTYKGDEDTARLRRKSIMLRAKEMSDILKTCADQRKHVKNRGFLKKAGASAGWCDKRKKGKGLLRHKPRIG